ncbi:MAG: hypothetical protein MJB14_10145 [Spirochaetes bacterium]|nr:hypothetical protein [Spirochaetota bacterium]
MKKYQLMIIFFLISFYTYSASISVDELKIIADGNFNSSNNEFEMNTYFKFITSFDGGYKFAAKVAFETNITELELNYTTSPLGMVYLFFNKAEVMAKNLAKSHLDLAFWTGTNQYLGSGNQYRGHLYYPESVDTDYQGFYRVRGTGVTSHLKFWEDRFVADIHIYQNANFIDASGDLNLNYFSFDSEVGLNFDKIKFSFFGGYTKDFILPNTNADLRYGRGKIGMKFWIGNEHVQFFSCFGFPNMDSATFSSIQNQTSNFFDLLYMVGELNFKLFRSIHTISFLTRPSIYSEKTTGASTNFDINYKFKIQVPDFPINGGFLFNLKYSLADVNDQWNIILAPYASITLSGVIWDFTVHYDFSRIQIARATGNTLTALEGLKIVIGASSRF